MAGRITVWGASELLMCFFAKTATPPPSFFLALVAENPPTPFMSGLELDEPDVVDYARVEVPNTLEYWRNDSRPEEVATELPVSFTTAVSDWGVLRYWALCNAITGGFNYFIGELENPMLIEAGDQAVLSEGDLSVSLGPFFLVEED